MAETTANRTLRDLLRMIFSRWLSAGLILAAVFAAVAAATYKADRVYEAQVTLLVPVTEAEREMVGDVRSDSIYEVLLKTHYEILTGDTVLSRAMTLADNRSLERGNLLAGDDPAAQAIESAARKIREKRQEDLIEFRKSVRMEVPGGETVGKAQVFTIYVRDKDRDRATRLAKLVHQEFVYHYYELVLTVLKGHEAAASAALTQIKAKRDKAALEYTAFLNKEAGGSESRTALLMSLLRGPAAAVGSIDVATRTQTSAREVESERLGLEALYHNLVAVLKPYGNAKTIDDIIAITGKNSLDQKTSEAAFLLVPQIFPQENTEVRTYYENLAAKRAVLAELVSRYTPDNQRLREVQKEIRLLEAELIGKLIAARKALESRIEQLRLKERSLAEGSPVQAETTAPGKLLTDLRQMESKYASLNNLTQEQEAAFERASMAYTKARASVQKIHIGEPSIPGDPIRPIVWLNLLIGAIVGLLLALTYVFLADHYDHSIRTIQDVEDHVGLPVLASVRHTARRPVRA